MARKKKFKITYVLIALVLILALSLTGVMNQVFVLGSGRSSPLTQGKLPCDTDNDCPEPKCVGSFSISERDDVSTDPEASEVEKAAAGLEDSWYDFQGDLKEVRCVEGKCETSPFCVMEYSDITDFLKNHPLRWIKEYFVVFIVMFALLIVIIWAISGK